MGKFAIYPPSVFLPPHPNELKSAILFFDKLLIIDEDFVKLKSSGIFDLSNVVAEYEYLIDKGLVNLFERKVIFGKKSISKEDLAIHDMYMNEFSKYPNISERYGRGEVTSREAVHFLTVFGDFISRHAAMRLNEFGSNDYVSILNTSNTLVAKNSKQEVISFIIDKLPVPADDVSWEQLIDFRNDPDSKVKLYALINWVNKACAGRQSASEIKEEFEYLYHQYDQHFNIHTMKRTSAKWELILNLGIDLLTSFSWPVALKDYFNVRKAKVTMMEDELKLNGREVAFIHKAKSYFGS